MTRKAAIKLAVLRVLLPCEGYPLSEDMLAQQVAREVRPPATEEEIKPILIELIASRDIASTDDPLDAEAKQFTITTKGEALLQR